MNRLDRHVNTYQMMTENPIEMDNHCQNNGDVWPVCVTDRGRSLVEMIVSIAIMTIRLITVEKENVKN